MLRMWNKKTNEQVEKMLQQIKSMEGIIGRERCKKFTEKTLKAQIKKGTITDEEFKDVMERLGYAGDRT